MSRTGNGRMSSCCLLFCSVTLTYSAIMNWEKKKWRKKSVGNFSERFHVQVSAAVYILCSHLFTQTIIDALQSCHLVSCCITATLGTWTVIGNWKCQTPGMVSFWKLHLIDSHILLDLFQMNLLKYKVSWICKDRVCVKCCNGTGQCRVFVLFCFLFILSAVSVGEMIGSWSTGHFSQERKSIMFKLSY